MHSVRPYNPTDFLSSLKQHPCVQQLKNHAGRIGVEYMAAAGGRHEGKK